MSFANPTDIQITKYAESYVIYGDQTKAIRNAFPDSKAKGNVLRNKAVDFHKLGDVQVTISNLHKAMNDDATETALFTAEQALNELDEARELAKIPNATGQPQTASMIAATNGKAKIAGLLIDKVESKDVTQPIVEYVTPDAVSSD